MNTVISSYDINLKTIALLPGRNIDYDTVVIEENKTKYIRQTSLNLIKDACLKCDWTTYEGRRGGVIKHTNFKQKTPIPIDMRKAIFFQHIHQITLTIFGLPFIKSYLLEKYHQGKD